MTFALMIGGVAAVLAVPLAWLLGERHGQRRGEDRAEQRGMKLGRALERGDAAQRRLADLEDRRRAVPAANPVRPIGGLAEAATVVLPRVAADPYATAVLPTVQKGALR